jgi:hypothetical protein
MRVLLAFILAFVLASAAAPQRPGEAVVTIRLAPDGIDAEFRLDHPVTRFAFADRSVVREGDFELRTAGLALKGDTISAAAPFRAFRLHIRPAAEERDAKYPAHFRVGAGGVLYAPSLEADEAGWHTRFVFATAPGEIHTPANGAVEEGFVFIGPKSLRRQYGDIELVADPAAPAWLVDRSAQALAAAVASYTDAFGTKLPRKPLLIVLHRPSERNFSVGDVTPGGITSLRFYGSSWMHADALAAKGIQTFVLHEAFHFWNGGLAHHEQETPTWLHEGGAEYASLLVGVRDKVLSEEEVRLRLGQALDRCRSGLQHQGDKGLAQIPFLSNQLRYPCGMVLQWAVDLRLRQASGGRRDVLGAWADTVRVARARPSHGYTLADFSTAAGIADAKAFAPIRLLAEESGAARWDALPAALNALGAEVGQAPSLEGRRGALLFHLLKRNCRNMAPDQSHYGFYFDNRVIKLDSPKGCGVLTGDPLLKSIEGDDPFEPSAETYEAVQRKCAAKQTVTFVTADGRTLAVPCDAPLEPAPLAYVVKRWMPADVAARR